MEIAIDYREFGDNPKIVAALRDSNKNTVISKTLDVGDYLCYPVLIEHKTLPNFVGDVKSGHIFQQAQDMLYSKQQNPELQPYILISGDIADIFKLQKWQNIQAKPLIAAWASLNRQGIPTSFVGNLWFLIHGMLYLFEKYHDGKNREYNPVRKPSTSDDLILRNYESIKWVTKREDGTEYTDGIGEITAQKLKEKFPIPKALYNTTKEQLMEIDGIGEVTANKLIKFFEGEKND